jgi:hypothetical protein
VDAGEKVDGALEKREIHPAKDSNQVSARLLMIPLTPEK